LPSGDFAYQTIEDFQYMSSRRLELVYEVPGLIGDVIVGVIEVEAPLEMMSVRIKKPK